MSGDALADTPYEFKIDDNELTREIEKRKGGTSQEDMEAYGKAAGAAGGAAACAAFLTPASAPLCGIVGGVIGEWVAKNIKMAEGCTFDCLVDDTLQKLGPGIDQARRNVLAFYSYDTMRKFAVQDLGRKKAQAAKFSEAEGMYWASGALTGRGVPALNGLNEYRPSAELRVEFLRRAGMLEDGTCMKGAGWCLPDPNSSDPHQSGIHKECQAAIKKNYANTCLEWFVLTNYGGFPPASPGEPIDWFLVAFAAHAEQQANTLLDKLAYERGQVEQTIYSVIALGSALRQLPGVNLPGHDYTSFNLERNDVALCHHRCQEDPNCKAYTFVKPGIQGPQARCWLKSGIPAAQQNACCVSGARTPASPEEGTFVVQHNENRPGNDYMSFDLQGPSAGLCQTRCQEDPRCKAYTFVRPGVQGPQARCWLKSAAPPAQHNTCCISGVRQSTGGIIILDPSKVLKQ
jgi:hypothetical protein